MTVLHGTQSHTEMYECIGSSPSIVPWLAAGKSFKVLDVGRSCLLCSCSLGLQSVREKGDCIRNGC